MNLHRQRHVRRVVLDLEGQAIARVGSGQGAERPAPRGEGHDLERVAPLAAKPLTRVTASAPARVAVPRIAGSNVRPQVGGKKP